MGINVTGAERVVEIRRTIAAPRQRVFEAWTRPEEVRKWAAPGAMTVSDVQIDLRVGGRFRIVMAHPEGGEHPATGVYREVDPPRRIVYTWAWETRAEAGEGLVTVEFHDRGPDTDVVLRHEGLPSEGECARHETGWNGCLDKFVALF